MPAVSPRASVRLRAVAVATSLSASLVVGLSSAPAQASVPAPRPALPATVVVQAARPAAVSFTLATTVQKPVAHKVAAKKVLKKVTKKKAAKKKAVTKHPVKKHAKQRHKPVAKVAKPAKPAARPTFGHRVIVAASRYRGTPYQYGASGPRRFDCSGFTRFIFAKFGISLPHSSSAQYSVVRHISQSQKRIGDLVFFHSGSGHVYHVGIYAGGGEIWAATHTGDFVRLEGIWNASYYVGRIS